MTLRGGTKKFQKFLLTTYGRDDGNKKNEIFILLIFL